MTDNTISAGSVTLGVGADVTCTITNNDAPAQLTLVKRVVNDNGGTKVVGDFGLLTSAGTVTPFSAGVADGANTLKYTSTTVTGLSAGAYTLRESDVAGYTEGTWSCTTGGTVTDNTISAGSVTLAQGADVTCTITNNDAPAQLTLVKRVVNDNGGTKVVGDFGLLTSAGTVTPFSAGVADGANTLKYTSTTVTGLSAGAYTLRESDVAGYTEGTWSCTTGGTVTDNTISAGSVTLVNGADVTCTITNNDAPAQLTLVKRVVNDNGGTKVVGDFGLLTSAGTVTPFSAGVADGANTLKYTSTTVTGLSAGAYTLRESDVAGYTEGTWSCTTGGTVTDNTISAGSVTLVNGADVTCTITNNDAPAQLTLVKRVVNDNGGTKVVGDFGLLTSAGTVTPFSAGVADGANTLKYTSQTVGVNAGAYTLRESDVAGYTEGTWSCTTGGTVTDNTISAGSVTLVNGADVTCTITNNDAPAQLTLVKRVVNDNGGTKVVGDFGLLTSAGTVTPFSAGVADGANTLKYTSTTVTGLSAGAYTLRESDVAGYTEGTWSCTTGGTVTDNTISAGSVTLVNGADVTCTITNNDAPAQLTLVKRVVNDNGGTKVVGDFGLLTSAGTVTPFSAGVADGANTLKYTSTTVTGLSAGAYTLRESDVAGYTEGTWSCTTGGTVTDNTISAGSVTLVNGADVTCTITNNDAPAQLTLVKRVVNDNGGTKVVGDFGLLTSAGTVTPFRALVWLMVRTR